MLSTLSTLDAVRLRRSCYALGSACAVTNERVLELVETALHHAPTAFHSQSGRVLLLFGEEHRKLWKIAEDILKPEVPVKKFPETWAKLQSLAAGRGTILFFDDTAVTARFAQENAFFGARFALWAEQSSAMLQYAVWLLLASEGLGASLQHYDPLIDDEVRRIWDLPQSWRLIAQLPFGQPYAAPGEKDRVPVETQLKVFGAH